jgi:hypothetical protein
MTWRQEVSVIAYWILKTSFGLLVHPYQMMEELLALKGKSKRRMVIGLVLTPGIYYGMSVVVWRLGLREVVNYLVTANCPLMIIKTGVVFFAGYWQLSLLYLWGKLSLGRRRKVEDNDET